MDMRATSILGLLAAATMFAAPASANSWHSPTVYEETNSDYSKYSYDDGLCQYRYYYNTFEKHAQASRYGDCTHLIIGPDGHVLQSAIGGPE
jgi:hypothetical protein